LSFVFCLARDFFVLTTLFLFPVETASEDIDALCDYMRLEPTQRAKIRRILQTPTSPLEHKEQFQKSYLNTVLIAIREHMGTKKNIQKEIEEFLQNVS